MTSERQIDANRRNAQQSTGPRTPEGRAASSRNALRHGFAAKKIVVYDEEPEDLEDSCASFYEDLAPVGANEESLVRIIAVGEWRRARFLRAEADLFNRIAAEFLAGDLDPEGGGLGAALQKAPAALALLRRYAAENDREVRQARHELERLQARRRGEAVAPPIAVDVSGEVKVSQGEAPQRSSPPSGETCTDQRPTPLAASAPADHDTRPAAEEPCAGPDGQAALPDLFGTDASPPLRNEANGTAAAGASRRLQPSGADAHGQAFAGHAPGKGVVR